MREGRIVGARRPEQRDAAEEDAARRRKATKTQFAASIGRAGERPGSLVRGEPPHQVGASVQPASRPRRAAASSCERTCASARGTDSTKAAGPLEEVADRERVRDDEDRPLLPREQRAKGAGEAARGAEAALGSAQARPPETRARRPRPGSPRAGRPRTRRSRSRSGRGRRACGTLRPSSARSAVSIVRGNSLVAQRSISSPASERERAGLGTALLGESGREPEVAVDPAEHARLALGVARQDEPLHQTRSRASSGASPPGPTRWRARPAARRRPPRARCR